MYKPFVCVQVQKVDMRKLERRFPQLVGKWKDKSKDRRLLHSGTLEKSKRGGVIRHWKKKKVRTERDIDWTCCAN